MRNPTDRAKTVMELANELALQFTHEHILPEHILLGIIKEGSGVANNSLKELNVSLTDLRVEIENRIVSGPSDLSISGKVPNSSAAKEVIDQAYKEQVELNHRFLGTEHLILGLLSQNDGIVHEVFQKIGVSRRDVRHEIRKLLGFETETPLVLNARANRVVAIARRASVAFGHREFGAIHVLYGIIAEPENDAAFLLRSYGIDRQKIHSLIKEEFSSTENKPALASRPKPGNDFALILDLAQTIAQSEKSLCVTAEHLMLAMLEQEAKSLKSAEVMAKLNVSTDELRSDLKDFAKSLKDQKHQFRIEAAESKVNKIREASFRLGRDLTQWATLDCHPETKVDERLIELCMTILLRRHKNNISLVGNRRLGMLYLKSIARYLVDDHVPEAYFDHSLIRVVTPLIDPEVKTPESIVQLLNQTRKLGTMILAFDSLDSLFDLESPYNKKVPLFGAVIPWLNLPNPRTIGLIEHKNLAKFNSASGVEQKFEVIDLNDFEQPSVIGLLGSDVRRLEDFHLCEFGSVTVDHAIERCRKHFPSTDKLDLSDCQLADQVVSLLDDAAATKSLLRTCKSDPPESELAVESVENLNKRLRQLERKMQNCREEGRYLQLAELDREFDNLLAKRISLEPLTTITKDDIDRSLARMLKLDSLDS